MKIYLANYIDRYDYNLLSIHQSKKGAKNAIDKHRAIHLDKYLKLRDICDKLEREIIGKFGENEQWEVETREVLN